MGSRYFDLFLENGKFSSGNECQIHIQDIFINAVFSFFEPCLNAKFYKRTKKGQFFFFFTHFIGVKTRVGKNPGFFKKPSPVGFFGCFWVLLGFMGFFGFYWVF